MVSEHQYTSCSTYPFSCIPTSLWTFETGSHLMSGRWQSLFSYIIDVQPRAVVVLIDLQSPTTKIVVIIHWGPGREPWYFVWTGQVRYHSLVVSRLVQVGSGNVCWRYLCPTFTALYLAHSCRASVHITWKFRLKSSWVNIPLFNG